MVLYNNSIYSREILIDVIHFIATNLRKAIYFYSHFIMVSFPYCCLYWNEYYYDTNFDTVCSRKERIIRVTNKNGHDRLTFTHLQIYECSNMENSIFWAFVKTKLMKQTLSASYIRIDQSSTVLDIQWKIFKFEVLYHVSTMSSILNLSGGLLWLVWRVDILFVTFFFKTKPLMPSYHSH